MSEEHVGCNIEFRDARLIMKKHFEADNPDGSNP